MTGTTLALLTVGLGTPLWTIGLILSGRGLALGLTIQPLLFATIGNLSGTEVPDGNTLFNVMERVLGSVGISLFTTYFQISEGDSASPLQAVGAALRAFHDTVVLLAVLSAVGLVLTLLLKSGGQIRANPEVD